MTRTRLARALPGGAIALALLCPAAHAGTPFTLGNGAHPDVAMDASGVAHVVWRERLDASNYAIRYCQVAAGAQACGQTLTLGGPTGLDDPLVVIGDAVYVVVPHYVSDTVDVFSSANGFASAVTLTEATPSNRIVGTNSEDAIFGPGQSITLTTWNPGQYVLNFPVPATAGPVTAANFSTPFVYNFSAALDGTTPVAMAWEIPNGGAPSDFGFWTATGPNLNDAASWSGPTTVGQGEEAALAGGRSGLFAMTTGNGAQTFPDTWEVRKFNGSGFGAPVVLATGERSNCQSCNDLFQDANGGLYAAWRAAGSTIRLATSSDAGATFVAPYEIVAEPVTVTIANMHVVSAPGGNGLVVYDQNSDTGEIRAANLAAAPPPPPVVGVAVNGQVVGGQVLVKRPAGARQAGGKGRGFVPLSQARQIPVGSILDTSRGTVALTAAANSSGATQVGRFTAGLFQILQARAARPVTRLKLTGGSFSSCGKTARAAKRKKLSPKTIRKLRSDAGGNFRSDGRFASATVRGTAWTMSDRCDGTLTAVKRGVVVVRDRLAKRSITLRAGKSYLARAR